MSFKFTNEQGKAMGEFVAALIIAGVKFEVIHFDGEWWEVTLTGGF